MEIPVYTLGVLNKIEGSVGGKLCEKFDLVFGTSTGAIMGRRGVQSTEALGYDDYIKLLSGVVGYNLNLVGCDLAEVSPQFDSAEITSPLAANLLFERICLFCFC
jgi:hypothetical protein